MLNSIRVKLSIIVLIICTLGFTAMFVFIQNKTINIVNSKTNRESLEIAQNYSEKVKLQLEQRLIIARTLAQSFTSLKKQGVMDRNTYLNILKESLIQNQNVFGIWAVWEPNVLDGKDSEFVKKEGHDQTGRFIPYYNRGKGDGTVTFEACTDYENTTTPVVSDYYQIPKKTGREVITDPATYTISGKNITVASIGVPIIIDNRFYGVVGIDFELTEMQFLFSQFKPYETGYLRLISHTQKFITHPNFKKVLTVYDQNKVKDKLQESLSQLKSFNFIDSETNTQRIFMPFSVGKTQTSWVVEVVLPLEKVMEDVDQLNDLILIIGIISLITITGLLFIALKFLVLNPLNTVLRFMQKIIDSGSFHHRIELNSKDEFAILSNFVLNLSDSINFELRQINQIVSDLAKGDLRNRLQTSSKGDFLELSLNINQSLDQLENLIKTVIEASQGIILAVEEISISNQDLSNRTVQTSTELNQTSSFLHTLSETFVLNSEQTQQANQLIIKTNKATQSGTQMTEEVISTMNEISEKSTQITNIIKMIDDIASQTNLLALNAAIEAARAGEYGRGFAVVADEVRALAQKSAESAQQISLLITDAVNKIHEGSHTVKAMADSIKEINQNIEQTSGIIKNISASSISQTTEIAQINESIHMMDDSTQQNAAMVEEMAATSMSIQQETAQLQKLTEHFKLRKT